MSESNVRPPANDRLEFGSRFRWRKESAIVKPSLLKPSSVVFTLGVPGDVRLPRTNRMKASDAGTKFLLFLFTFLILALR